MKPRKQFLHFLFLVIFFTATSCKKEFKVEEIPPVTGFWELNGKSSIDLSKQFDIVIYGGTPAGIMGAIEGVRSGKNVLLINHTEGALGGMLTNGLGNTDVLHPEILGGLSREFFKRIKDYYSNQSNWFVKNSPKYGWDPSLVDIMVRFEPRAAQTVFKDLIMTHSLPILHKERIKLKNGVGKRNGIIEWIEMESGKRVKGKVFIDASYEGDLMAGAKVSYIVGREANSVYGESFNGIYVADNTNRNQIPDGVKINVSNFSSIPFGTRGGGDSKVQAYCYRMCLTDVADNMVKIEKPHDYDESNYELLFKYLEKHNGTDFFDLSLIPNRKTDSNNSGPVSTDFVGANYQYPEGDYVLREEIRRKHKSYQLGLMWTLQNHPAVPGKIKNHCIRWGLAKDEFSENNNWPLQLYIREARRMVGSYIMTEHNCNNSVDAPYSIGLADYPMDSHIVQRFTNEFGHIKNEGQIMARVPNPYKIDFRSLIPKENECKNLIVPVCLSASHIAYGSIRMEPIYMTLGQVSTIIAINSILEKKPVQKIDYIKLKESMLKRGMVY
ncbi:MULTISPECIES: FAD-dependent oxidoreductase [unclassified Sphingobacterium]|uniref:FAD-dependent oxidoreductase n=1 Tax=unclassified Sphingobacterium TaxID=2609468 RepID=UPI0020C34380|nr:MULTISPECIES: FAD-dependent oxidoreductase [unclassified Sphingobacterium]